MLRSNHGAVHATIDQLLSMTTDTEHQVCAITDDSSSCVETMPVAGGGGSGGGSGGCHLEALLGGMGATNNELPPSYALSATPPPSYQQAVPSQSPYPSPM